MSFLQIMWFLLIGVLLTVYAILDGFDLGIGIWHLSTKTEKHRRTMFSLLGPIWDGNEVWLLTGGGAIFAAFPHVYATVFSGFYLALFLVIMALISRAVAIEFRNQHESALWKKIWDVAFALGSIAPAILFGVAMGNILRGAPLDRNGAFIGTFLDLLNPYALLAGLMSFAMFATHGALYIALRTRNELREQAIGWARTSWFAYINLFALITIFTMQAYPHLIRNYLRVPLLTGIPVLTLVGIIAIFGFLKQRNLGAAFTVSALTIAGMMGICGSSMYPFMVRSTRVTGTSLTIFNASSSALTLQTMLILAMLVVPIVIGYTYWTYRQFWGKVDSGSDGY